MGCYSSTHGSDQQKQDAIAKAVNRCLAWIDERTVQTLERGVHAMDCTRSIRENRLVQLKKQDLTW